MTSKIFISHAAADKELVAKFVDMLRLGVDIQLNQIFCTSLQGMGIPGGETFVSFIKKELIDCKFVISILTPSYFESQFCMSELGAAWVLTDKQFCPLLVPPLSYDDLKAVLTGVHAGSIINKDYLSQLHDRLRAALELNSGSTANWEVQRDGFIKAFPNLTIKGFSNVPFAQYEKLEQKYDTVQTAFAAKDVEIADLIAQIADLEKCKDASEVKAVRQKFNTVQQELDALTQAFKDEDLPKVVIEALDREERGQPWRPNTGFDQNHVWDAAESAEHDGFLSIDDNEISTRSSHPPVKRAANALHELSLFINQIDPAFATEFEEEHDYELTLNNRSFWCQYLGLTNLYR